MQWEMCAAGNGATAMLGKNAYVNGVTLNPGHVTLGNCCGVSDGGVIQLRSCSVRSCEMKNYCPFRSCPCVIVVGLILALYYEWTWTMDDGEVGSNFV
jgi:hypothetical protein